MDEILGAMAGALVPVAVQWSRYDDQTQQRVRNTRYDLRDLRDAWQESLGWGGAVRSRLPIVMDWDTGLAMATSQQPTAQTIPTLPSGQLRPNLCNGAESFVSSMTWPPRPGMYDARQNVQQVGELSTTALAVTYEEVRTAIHAFVSCNGSTPAGRVQLYRSINALTDTVMSLNLTKAEFAARWALLFGVPVTTIDPHRDPSKSPTIGNINVANNVASVVFVSTGTNNEVNPQTDAGHRLRITATGGGPIAVLTDVCTVTFASPYRYKRADGSTANMQPQVHIQSSSEKRVIVVVSYTGYTIQLADVVSAGTSLDVSVIVEPGVPTL